MRSSRCRGESTTTTIMLRPFVWDYPGEPAPEETLTHPPSYHHPIFISFFHLPRSRSNSVLGNLFAQPALSMSSLVYLLVWSPPPHIPYISSPNQCLFFAAHAHSITTCFAVVSILYHLFLVFLVTPSLELCFYLNITHPSDHSHLCSLKCHLVFFPDRPGLTSV